MNKINLIEWLVAQGFRITSDPNLYTDKYGNPRPWGLRIYTVNGYNYDKFCDGYHRAYDFGKYHGAPIPAYGDGEVVSGTDPYGNFGGTVVIIYKDIGVQVIYGHLDRDLPVKVGDTVKRGQTIGYQSNTNYDNVPMDSHLHIQFQEIGYIESEKAFVCTGIDPLRFEIEDADEKTHTVAKGETLWGIAKNNDMTVESLKALNCLDSDVIGIGQVLKLSGDPLPQVTEKPQVVERPKPFNPNVDRPRSSEAYLTGEIDNLGASVRKRKGNVQDGFSWSTEAGYELHPGEIVYIFEVHQGWGRIYTGRKNGQGSNEWIWLGRLDVTEVFK